MKGSSSGLPRPSDRIDRYRILTKVAHGGMAVVYAVRRSDVAAEKILAMKLILPHLADDPRFIDMFLDEARIAAEVEHPNVVQMFEVGLHQSYPYMVMEYLRGRSLAHVLAAASAGDALPRSLLLMILADAAEGLHAAHEACNVEGAPLSIVHRDISPQNIHVGYDGRVKVVDFGIAAAAGRVTSTKTGEIKGKLRYVSPEQLHRRSPLDRRSDVWALGVVLWETLTGLKLFRGDADVDTMFNVLHKKVPDIQGQQVDVSDDLAECVMSSLRRDPEKRPASADVVAKVLRSEIGRCDRSALAVYMQERFADARASDEARLASALRDAPPSVGSIGLDEAEGVESATTIASSARGKNRPLRKWVGLGAIGLAGGLAVVLASSSDRRLGAETPLTTAAPFAVAHRPLDTEERTEPERTIELEVDPNVRLVLVNGQLREDRPLVLSLAESEHAEVVVVGPNGEQHLNVGVDDDGRRLAAPTPAQRMRSPVRRSSQRARRRDTTERVDGRNTGLLDVEL